MSKQYPKTSRVVIPQPYRHSTDTDIRKTIKAAQKRLDDEAKAKAEAVAPRPLAVIPLRDMPVIPVEHWHFNCAGEIRRG